MPSRIGLKLEIAPKKTFSRSAAMDAMGPMIHSVRQKVTVQVIRGTANSLIVSGMNF